MKVADVTLKDGKRDLFLDLVFLWFMETLDRSISDPALMIASNAYDPLFVTKIVFILCCKTRNAIHQATQNLRWEPTSLPRAPILHLFEQQLVHP